MLEVFPGLWNLNTDMNGLKQIGAKNYGIRVYYSYEVSGNNNSTRISSEKTNSYNLSKHPNEVNGYYGLENGNELINDWRPKK